MNLKRGLLRLWVLLALAWVAPTTWLLWDELTMTKLEFLVTMANNKKYSISGPDPRGKSDVIDRRVVWKFWGRVEEHDLFPLHT